MCLIAALIPFGCGEGNQDAKTTVANDAAGNAITNRHKQYYHPSPSFLSRNTKIILNPAQLYADNMAFPFSEWMSLKHIQNQDITSLKWAFFSKSDSTFQIDTIGYWIADSLIVSGYYSNFPTEKKVITKWYTCNQDSIALSINEIAQILRIRDPYNAQTSTKTNPEQRDGWALKRTHSDQLKAHSWFLYPNGNQTSFEVFYVLYFHRVIQNRLAKHD